MHSSRPARHARRASPAMATTLNHEVRENDGGRNGSAPANGNGNPWCSSEVKCINGTAGARHRCLCWQEETIRGDPSHPKLETGPRGTRSSRTNRWPNRQIVSRFQLCLPSLPYIIQCRAPSPSPVTKPGFRCFTVTPSFFAPSGLDPFYSTVSFTFVVRAQYRFTHLTLFAYKYFCPCGLPTFSLNNTTLFFFLHSCQLPTFPQHKTLHLHHCVVPVH